MIDGSRIAGFYSQPFPHWRRDSPSLTVCFAGRQRSDRSEDRHSMLRDIKGSPEEISWLRQRHSATALEASAGACGDGDALWSTRPGLALSVVTADCVPIVCGTQGVVAVIHAGWRGLAGGVIEAALARLGVPAARLEAWIGPAIGPCCYEVDDDVADTVVEASTPEIASNASSGKPHLDLPGAARHQLGRLGVERVEQIRLCTKCNPDLLWSYRGASRTNGRNFTFAWLKQDDMAEAQR